MRRVAQSVLSLAASPNGFTASQLAEQLRTLSRQTQAEYHARQAAYDLKKLRARQFVPFVRRIPKSQRYETTAARLKAMTALIVLREKVIKPLLAAAQAQRKPRKAAESISIEKRADGQATYW